MKKIFTLILMVLCATTLFAQAPEKFSYQAVVRNASNALVVNAPVGVRVSILQGGVNGTLVYMETQTAVTNANGLISLQIGSGNVQQGSFADIDWANGTYFLKTETDPAGGTNYSVTSTQQMLSVPYALFAKDAGNGFSGDYNDLTNAPTIPTVPTIVSAFTNDAGYITGYTETDPTVPAWAKEANKPTYNYSEIANTPAIPTVPTNVSSFTNDAGYITMDSIPGIPTVPTNVSAFTNDVGYITGYTETDPTVPAWAKEANKPTYNYSEIVNTPAIPTVPTNVSAFTNDTGYLTSYTETDPTVPAWAKEATKPAYDYSEIANTPVIPTVPTNVSAFTNDTGYLTSYTETDPQFNAWDKDYNDLINKPVIPSIPTNVSAFTNDAGYVTALEVQQTAGIPTVVSAFQNDANYITIADVPAHVNADWNATSGKAQILNKPTLFSGNYNDLTNKPTIPVVPTVVSSFTNDAGYISSYTETDPLFNAWDKNYNDLTNKPTLFSGDYNDLTNRPTIPTLPTNVSAFTNDAGYVTIMEVQQAASVPSVVSAFQNDANYITLEDVPAQVNADWNATSGKAQILNKPTLFSGNYNDLTNKPTIPVVPTVVSSFTNDAGYISSYTETDPQFNAWDKNYNDLTNKPTLFSGNYNDLSNKPNLAAVATSGNYNDLSNTPSIPTVPTNVSSFTNDAGYVTADQLNAANYITASQIPTQVNADWNATSGVAQILNKPALFSGNYNDLTNKPIIPTVPTNVSSFTNDAYYITYNQLISLIDSIKNTYNSKIDSLNNVISSIDNQSSLPCGTYVVSDFDGNMYTTVPIGSQCWLKQNLRTTKYSDGEPITAGGVGTGNWTSSSTIAYWYYPNEQAIANHIDGYMYNIKAVLHNDSYVSGSSTGVQGPCPNGWHVPSESEWNSLVDYVLNNNLLACGSGAAKALASTSGWTSTGNNNCCPTSNSFPEKANRTGFSALPCGYLKPASSGSSWGFLEFGETAYFWAAPSTSNPRLFRIRYSHATTDITSAGMSSWYAFPVRCLRD